MTIYVLRANDIVKIGHTEDLPRRVSALMSSIPMEVKFVGHMPGGRDVEKHLHMRFDATRFSGEWFYETEEMRAVWSALLTRHIPKPAKGKDLKRISSGKEAAEARNKLRQVAVQLWPDKSHGERIDKLSTLLGWNRSRVKDFYYGDKRAVLRSFESEEIDALIIAPELAERDSE